MNLNKITLILSFSCLAAAIIFYLSKLNSMELQKVSLESSIDSNESSFEFETLDGHPFTNLNFPKDKPYMIMYMDPTCDDCDKMMRRMFKYYSEFENIHIIMATESDISQVIRFKEEYKIDNYENIEIVLDPNQVMYKQFNLIEYPSFVIYDAHQNLIKKVDEFVTLPIVVKYVREAIKKSS